MLRKDSTIQGWSPGPGQGKREDPLQVSPGGPALFLQCLRPRGCCKLAGKWESIPEARLEDRKERVMGGRE